MLKWVQQQRAAAAAAVPSGAEQKQDQWGRKGEEGRWKGKNNNICGVRDKALSVRSHPQAKGPFTTLSLSLSLSLLLLLASYSCVFLQIGILFPILHFWLQIRFASSPYLLCKLIIL
jgi:hypothetical protein